MNFKTAKAEWKRIVDQYAQSKGKLSQDDLHIIQEIVEKFYYCKSGETKWPASAITSAWVVNSVKYGTPCIFATVQLGHSTVITTTYGRKHLHTNAKQAAKKWKQA